jgi:hypothetical protein
MISPPSLLVPDEGSPGPYSAHRLFEWAVAVMMVLMALTLALPGDTMERGALAPLAQAGFTEGNMAGFFGVTGALRGLALYANGNLNPQGALVRAFGAIAGAVVWGQMTLALLADAFDAAAPSLMIPVFGTLTMFDLLSCYRARIDAGRRHDAALARLAKRTSTGVTSAERTDAGGRDAR